MDVYISHANTDSKLAKRLATTLRASGFNVWDDTQLSYGDTFSSSLDKALEQSNAMVVLLTPNTADSPYFSKEIEHALTNKAYKNRVIPVVAADYDQLDFHKIPWILKKFHVIHAPNLGESGEGLEQISQALMAVR